MACRFWLAVAWNVNGLPSAGLKRNVLIDWKILFLVENIKCIILVFEEDVQHMRSFLFSRFLFLFFLQREMRIKENHFNIISSTKPNTGVVLLTKCAATECSVSSTEVSFSHVFFYVQDSVYIKFYLVGTLKVMLIFFSPLWSNCQISVKKNLKLSWLGIIHYTALVRKVMIN